MIQSTIRKEGHICDLCKEKLAVGTKVGVSFGFPHHLGGCNKVTKISIERITQQQ